MNEQMVKRFWAKVRKTRKCWLWQAAKITPGYGSFFLHRSSGKIINLLAHRVSWELAHGPIPEGMCVLHKCDVRACVRPDHLFLGSRGDNAFDMIQKGRNSPPPIHLGESNCNAKLTADKVARLRHDRLRGFTYVELGMRYGVSWVAAYNVVKRNTWNHV